MAEFAINKQTGEVLTLNGGQWSPAPAGVVAKDKNGGVAVFDGGNWRVIQHGTIPERTTDLGDIGMQALARAAGMPTGSAMSSPHPPLAGAATAMRQDLTGQLLGATQGTSPYAQLYETAPIGEVVETDAGYMIQPPNGEWIPLEMKTPEGSFRAQGTENYVAVMGNDGKVMAYERGPNTDESVFSSLGRILGPGMLSGPVTSAPRVATQFGKVIDQFNEQAIPPNVATVFPNRTAHFIHNTLRDFPPSAGLVQRRGEIQNTAAARALDRVAGGFGTAATNIDAGGQIQRGLQQFIKQDPETLTGMLPGEIISSPTRAVGFNNKSSALYDSVAKHIPAETSVDMAETLASMRSIGSKFQNVELGQALQSTRGKFLETMADIIERSGGVLSWQDASYLRTELGKLTRGRQVIEGLDVGEISQVYKALLNDLGKAAEAAGPDAAASWRLADDFYKTGTNHINNVLNKFLKLDQTGAPTVSEEGAYRMLTQMMLSDKASESAKTILAIKNSLNESEWGDVASTLLRKLGEPAPSVRIAGSGAADEAPRFMAATFVTNFEKLSPSAKDALFGNSALRTELDKLVDTLNRMKAVESLQNFPRTAGVAGTMGLGAGLIWKPIKALSVGVLANLGARAMTSPVFLRWMRGLAEGQVPKDYASELARLHQLARLDPSLREVAAALSAATAEENQ